MMFVMFEIIWLTPEQWIGNKVRYRFRYKPRKFSVTVACLIILPYILVKSGLEGIVNLFLTAYDPLMGITNEFIRDKNEKTPTRWEAYEKFFI